MRPKVVVTLIVFVTVGFAPPVIALSLVDSRLPVQSALAFEPDPSMPPQTTQSSGTR